jgi:histidinol-phosphate aminotransferase
LQDDEHQERTRQVTHEGREYLEMTFAELGLEYIPSYANFVLVKVGDGDAMFQQMLRKGVIVRAMRAYKLPEWIRVSVGTMPQNEKFVRVLREILGK